MSAERIIEGDQVGKSLLKSAPAPAVCGLAIDVPLMMLYSMPLR